MAQDSGTDLRNASDDIELACARMLHKQKQDYKTEEVKVEETCPDGFVDIRGLDKFRLLEAMCANRRPSSTFLCDVKKTELKYLDRDYVEKMVAAAGGCWSFDYFRGHCIKSDLSGPWMRVWGYDRDVVGIQLKAAEIVKLLRDNPTPSRSSLSPSSSSASSLPTPPFAPSA
jgi:hypothetical protein